MVRAASLGRALGTAFAFRRSLAGQVALRIAVVDLVMLAVTLAAAGAMTARYVDGLVQAKVTEGMRQAETELRDDESLLVGSARQIANSPVLADALASGDASRLRASTIAMEVGQGFDAVWVVGADDRTVVAIGAIDPTSLARAVAQARTLLETTAFTTDQRAMIAAALYRSSSTPARSAVVVVARSLEGQHLADIGRAEGMSVSFVAPERVSKAERGAFTYDTRHGALIGVVVRVDTRSLEEALPRALVLLGTVGLAASAVVAALALVVVARGFRPFDVLARAARELAAGSSYELVPEKGPDDVVAVAAGFNVMARAVAEREADLRRMYREAHEAAVAAEHRATHDVLTELPNRVVLRGELERAIAEGAPFALLMLDLDDFKDVNDTFGHAIGDRVLVLVAERLRRFETPTLMATRLGGDEFALVARHAGARSAVRAARAIVDAFAEPFLVEHENLSVGATFGIALYPLNGSDPTTLMRHADVAMYQAKVARSGVHLYDATDDPDPSRRMGIASALRVAISQAELQVVYQPKVDLRSGRVVQAEALVRWESERYGDLPPSEFIPVAEHTGTIRPLTHLVLHRALRQTVRWRSEGKRIAVAVNISARSLMDPAFAGTVRSLLRETGAEPGDLICEITESTVMTDQRRALATMTALHHAGVRFSLDDFGTGYSSLALLHDLPIDEIKIDRSFVGRAVADEGSAEIVRAIVQIARAFGVRVVAEGIEDAKTAALLLDLGCDLGQGFFHARPGPAAAIEGETDLAPSASTRYA